MLSYLNTEPKSIRCPKCGGEANFSYIGFLAAYYIYCTKCHRVGKLFGTLSTAIKAWRKKGEQDA